jgi:hypothetical protein
LLPLCFDREPKARVATTTTMGIKIYTKKIKHIEPWVIS